MRLTIDNISQILKVPTSIIIEAIEELGIKSNENQVLSEAEIKKLRPILFRYYQRFRVETSERQSVDETARDSLEQESDIGITSQEDIEESASAAVTDSEDIAQTVSVNSFLEQLILNHVIMIDTCSIMHDRCDILLNEMCPILKKHNKKIVIPNKVIEELKKHLDIWNDPSKAALAEKGLGLCKMLRNQNCLTIRGSKNDNFTDNVFFVHFADLKFKYNMLLITQDYKLSHDILQLNNMKTGGGNPVKVFRISSKGTLIETIE